MSTQLSLNSSMSRTTTHPEIPATSSSSSDCDLDLDGFDFIALHHPVHPIFRQPPPTPTTTPTAVCTSQNVLLRPSTAPFPSFPPPLRLRSRHPTIALPDELPFLEGDLSLHSILHGSPSPSLLRWDVRMDPYTARCKLNRSSIPQQPYEQRPQQWHNQPACTPPLDRIFIYTDVFPGQLIVARPNDCDSSVVTIYDVLVAVYRAIQSARTEDGAGPKEETDILGARRVESGDPERQKQGAEPDRRSDRLGWSRWRWGGLVLATKGEEGWKLVLK